MKRTSNPSGDPSLEHASSWYDRSYGSDPKNYRGPAIELPFARLIWIPAIRISYGRILDVGCGMGHLAELARAAGREYVRGIDYSSVAIDRARERCPGVEFVVADAIDAVRSDDYDTAVMIEVLEHVYCDREIVEAVPAGRRVVLSVPNFQTEGHCRWFASWEEAAERYGDLIHIDAGLVRSVSVNSWFLMTGVRSG